MNAWGKHAFFDCRGCEKSIISNGDLLRTFSRMIVERIDMKAYGEPKLEHFANHDPNKGGYTLCQFIETSAITGHFVDLTGEAYIDIFSCKDFDAENAREFIKDFFKAENVKMNIMERQA